MTGSSPFLRRDRKTWDRSSGTSAPSGRPSTPSGPGRSWHRHLASRGWSASGCFELGGGTRRGAARPAAGRGDAEDAVRSRRRRPRSTSPSWLAGTNPVRIAPCRLPLSTEPMTATPSDVPTCRLVDAIAGRDARLRAGHAGHRGVGDRRVHQAEPDTEHHVADQPGTRRLPRRSAWSAAGRQRSGPARRSPAGSAGPGGRRSARTAARRPAIVTAIGSR